jgi:hypothetical protein
MAAISLSTRNLVCPGDPLDLLALLILMRRWMMGYSQSPALPAILGRFVWMLAGPMALVLMTFAIVSEGGGWLTVFDVLYFLILAGMLFGRRLEFRGGSPHTATGEPATEHDFRRYVLIAMIAAPVVWVLANLIGNHWLSR